MKIKLKVLSNKNNIQVYLLNEKFIVKKAATELIQSERLFFTMNRGKLFEKILYTKNDIIVYKFVPNKSNQIKLTAQNYEKYSKQLKKVINNYKELKIEGYGKIYTLKNSWSEFLFSEINSRIDTINDKEKTEKVIKVIKRLEEYPFKKKVIHGDLGIYNMIYNERKIKLIIDPNPILGDKLYDVAYFLFSNLNFWKIENIDKISIEYEEPKLKVIYMMYVVLYIRISIEIKHNNEEKKRAYNQIWKQIENEEAKMKK